MARRRKLSQFSPGSIATVLVWSQVCTCTQYHLQLNIDLIYKAKHKLSIICNSNWPSLAKQQSVSVKPCVHSVSFEIKTWPNLAKQQYLIVNMKTGVALNITYNSRLTQSSKAAISRHECEAWRALTLTWGIQTCKRIRRFLWLSKHANPHSCRKLLCHMSTSRWH